MKSTLKAIYRRLFAEEVQPVRNRVKNQSQEEILVSNRRRDAEFPLRFIHIGYPKCGSTLLQKGYFGRHPEILDLGCGNRTEKGYWDSHGYISSEINNALEVHIRYGNTFSYDENKTRLSFEKYFELATSEDHIHAVGISNENLSFNWHGGVDSSEKAKRLLGIFGKGTKIIMVVRRQKELLESLYKECIRFGYTGDFVDFLKYIWQFKFKNFFEDFHYNKMYSLYQGLFGAENVKVVFFEDLKFGQSEFLRSLSHVLEVDDIITSIGHNYNKMLSDEALLAKLELNKKIPHSLGNGFFEGFDTHRYVSHFTKDLGELEFGKENYLDHHLRNSLNSLSEKLVKLSKTNKIQIKWNSKYGSKILKSYNQSNRDFYALVNNDQIEKYNYCSQ